MACIESDIKVGGLLVRATSADTGSRPMIEPCTGYWLSPDLFLTGGTNITTAKVGVPNTVNVRVKNISQKPLDIVKAKAWVCNYTLGIGPGSGILSAGGSAGLDGDLPGVLNPNDTQVIPCNPTWTPLASDVGNFNGHVCLAAMVWAEDPTDGISVPPANFIPKFCCDTHFAQCNIAIEQADQRGGGQMQFHMMVANGEERVGNPRAQMFTVVSEEVTFRRNLTEPELELLNTEPFAKHNPQPSDIRVPEFGVSVGGGCLPGSKPKHAPREQVSLLPGMKRRATFQMAFDAREKVGAYHVFDLSLINSAGSVVGGGSVIVVLFP